ncbi:hypothetical protein [Allorhizobium borbori]|uniref:Uncharacterized protein n=1 Tax=Allorhizobium borbori TaxID=485907 RepID=A0A7W6K8J9_9HYPH|nr:hypothetical protein [Allorhizobium borbori]MBB4106022.1 hypothetical protein [Allorhizobium borbori]
MVAEQHAASAVDIVERASRLRDPIKTKDGRNNISGREAYFLRAVARRVRAREPSDFTRSGEWLDIAEKMLGADRKVGAKTVPYIRFNCERLALSLARYYFARASDENDPHNLLANRIFDSASDLASRLEFSRGKITCEDEPSKTLPASTQVNIAINLLQVLVVARTRSEFGFEEASECPIDDSDLAFCLSVITENTDYNERVAELGFSLKKRDFESEPEVICSALILRYTAAASKILKSPKAWYPRRASDVDRLFASEIVGNITLYDSERYRVLSEFLKLW